MSKENFDAAFRTLWSDLNEKDSFPAKRPLLAHYTSISVLEQIMANDELWFSNPLQMNDQEELRFGMNEGAFAFRSHEGLEAACGNKARHQTLRTAFDNYFSEFDEKHVFDTYVLCLSKHDEQDKDGLLSMWRGYGGNGSGAAIIFDASKINQTESSPLILSSVMYASREERLSWIHRKIDEVAKIITDLKVPDEFLYLAAYYFLERIKLFALFTKHHGFREEREWRIAYLSERDPQRRFGSMLKYMVGPRGVEPKLKFQVKPISGLTAEDLSLEKLIHKIILGPTASSPIAVRAVQRMLENLGKASIAAKVSSSSTPFRNA